jgi:primase-polymerase (primpol)-like protein
MEAVYTVYAINNKVSSYVQRDTLGTAIPDEWKEREQWLVWLCETHKGNPKPTKVPYNVRTERKASHAAPETWASFSEVCNALADSLTGQPKYDRLGFVFSEGDPYTGVDLDDVRNVDTGETAS